MMHINIYLYFVFYFCCTIAVWQLRLNEYAMLCLESQLRETDSFSEYLPLKSNPIAVIHSWQRSSNLWPITKPGYIGGHRFSMSVSVTTRRCRRGGIKWWVTV